MTHTHLTERALNFSWVREGKLAGCRGLYSDEELRFLAGLGIEALVRLAPETGENVSTDQVQAAGLEDCYEPVEDFTAPSYDQVKRVVAFIQRMLEEGKRTAVSCRAGYGRTGTLLTCYLVAQGLTTDAAIAEVRSKGRAAYESQAQLEAIEEYGQSLRFER